MPSVLNKPIQSTLRLNFAQFIAEKSGMFNAKYGQVRFSKMIGQSETGLLKTGSQAFTQCDLDKLFLHKTKIVTTSFDDEINQKRLDNVLAIDYKTYQLDDILTKIDRSTMSVSLEGREPYWIIVLLILWLALTQA